MKILLILASFILLTYYAYSLQYLSIGWLYYLLFVNMLTFIFYGMDKLAAVKQWQRTPEKHFYLLALLAGWPGSILGQMVFNHKTTKVRFRIVFYCMSLMNLVMLISYFYFIVGVN